MWHYGISQSQHGNNDNVDKCDACECVVWILLVDFFNVKTYDIWEGNVTTRREILTKHIHAWGCRVMREGVTLQRVTLWRSMCTCLPSNIKIWSPIHLETIHLKWLGLYWLRVLFSLFSMTHLGNAKKKLYYRGVIFSLINMTNGVKLLYYRGNTKT